MKTLYKLTSTNKIQEWTIEVEGNKYRTIVGQKDGKKVTSQWTICEGKNIGKKNETSPEQQAYLEAASAYKKKLEKGYMLEVEDVASTDFKSPMLAKIYQDYKQDLNFPVYIQPKLDGIRSVVNKKIKTRANKDIVVCPHILEVAKVILNEPKFNTLKNFIRFDGELYNHIYKNDFNSIVSIVKKSEPTEKNLQTSKSFMQYWVYDIDMAGKFSERYATLKKIFKFLENSKIENSWHLVPTYICESFDDIEKYNAMFLEQGYEGSIIRIDEVYEHKRSKFLLKLKQFTDAEFEIIDIIEGVGNRSGTAGYAILKINNTTFKSNIKGSFDYLSDLLNNKELYIGKEATVKYFNLTPDGIPRFGVITKIDKI